jgi:hypothetical protein
VAAWQCPTTLARMCLRSLTEMPWSLAHDQMPPLRSWLAAVRPVRRGSAGTTGVQQRHPKSQTKSQRPPISGHDEPPPVMIAAGRRHASRCPAPSSYPANAPYKRGVTGSNPVAPTRPEECFEYSHGGCTAAKYSSRVRVRVRTYVRDGRFPLDCGCWRGPWVPSPEGGFQATDQEEPFSTHLCDHLPLRTCW